LVPVPFALAELQASVLQFLPTPPLTPGLVELLKRDNVVSAAAKREGRTLERSESSRLQSRRSSRRISGAFAVEGNVNVAFARPGQPVAESVERRAGAEGNVHQQSTPWTQIRKRVTQALDRVRQVRRQTPKVGDRMKSALAR
jgi:hypothetical protein